MFHAEGWTDGHADMTKLIVSFRNAANAPKKVDNQNAKETYRSEASNNSLLCEIASFRGVCRWLVTGISELHVGPIFKDQAGFFDCLSLEDRTGVLSQNINNQLQTYATQRHTRAKTLSQIVTYCTGKRIC